MSNDQQSKALLIEQMSSRDEGALRQAIEELRKKGWLADGSLNGVCLCDVNLAGEHLWGANLQNVNLSRANLQGTNLQGCKLEGAVLEGADLQDAQLRSSYIGSATFSEETILPDGTHWVHDIDMTRFTDPNHPHFWRSEDPQSPAHRGDESERSPK